MSLSASDLRKIIEIIDIVYSVPDNHAMFRAVCEKLQRHIGFCDGTFSYADPQTGAFLLSGVESFDNRLGAVILYLSHYVQQDAFVRSGWFFDRNRLNVSARNTDLVPENVFAKSEFACDFLLPVANVFYSIAATLASQGDIVARVGFHRQKQEGRFTDRDKEIVDILLSHIAKAIHRRNLMSRVDLSGEQCGVIAIGEDRKPFYMNHTARQLLKGVPVESIPEHGPRFGPVFYRSKSGTYRVRTMPLSQKAKGKIVLLERYPPENKVYPWLADFKLTRREKEITVLVVQGYSNREIAERLFISEQTVKDHLHAIYEKFEIKSRGELTAKVLGLRAGQWPS